VCPNPGVHDPDPDEAGGHLGARLVHGGMEVGGSSRQPRARCGGRLPGPAGSRHGSSRSLEGRGHAAGTARPKGARQPESSGSTIAVTTRRHPQAGMPRKPIVAEPVIETGGLAVVTPGLETAVRPADRGGTSIYRCARASLRFLGPKGRESPPRSGCCEGCSPPSEGVGDRARHRPGGRARRGYHSR